SGSSATGAAPGGASIMVASLRFGYDDPAASPWGASARSRWESGSGPERGQPVSVILASATRASDAAAGSISVGCPYAGLGAYQRCPVAESLTSASFCVGSSSTRPTTMPG